MTPTPPSGSRSSPWGVHLPGPLVTVCRGAGGALFSAGGYGVDSDCDARGDAAPAHLCTVTGELAPMKDKGMLAMTVGGETMSGCLYCTNVYPDCPAFHTVGGGRGC